MRDAKYNRLPHAGDFEKEQGVEVLYLAPRPLPTGVNAFSGQRMHKEINGVFLDFAPSAGGLEFAVRVSVGSIVNIFVLFFSFWFRFGFF